MRTRTISGSVYKETYNLVEKRLKELGLKDKATYVRYLVSNDLGINGIDEV